jgi:hypothetical protein
MAKQSKPLPPGCEMVSKNGRWHLMVNGVSRFDSASEWYAKSKAEQFVQHAVEETVKSVQFPVNDRFAFVIQLIDMIAKKQVPSGIITGEGGIGKSWVVMEGLKKAGLKDVSEMPLGAVAGAKTFRMVKGYSTPKGLYRILFENQNNVVVFDDCDDVHKDPTAINILKGALDSYDKRIITWNTSLDGDDLPRSFLFNGAVIFISNYAQENISQALRTRALCIDLSMTVDQKLERMRTIAFNGTFLPFVKDEHKKDALALLEINKNKCRELSLRSLIQVAKVRANDAPNWKKLAEYLLLN